MQLLSFFEASTLCKDECNFEGPAVFPSEATTLNRPLAAEYSPWRAPNSLANRLANLPPFPRHTHDRCSTSTSEELGCHCNV